MHSDVRLGLAGGGSLLRSDMRRLLVCGATELQRMEAAAKVRDTAAPQVPAAPTVDPWALLSGMPWPQSINEWGQPLGAERPRL